MSDLIYDDNNNNEILEKIIEIILATHPIVKDRLNILYPNFNEPSTPEMSISFNFYKRNGVNITQISFLDGDQSFKHSIQNLNILGLINEEVLYNLINYLLTDHDYFQNIDIHEKIPSFCLQMDVNGKIENMHGISCGLINLNFNFYYHPEGKKLFFKYLNAITTTFYKQLQETPTIKKAFTDYSKALKEEFLSSISYEDLKSFFNLLNNNDRSNLINLIPDDHFIQLYNKFIQQDKIKKIN